MTIRILLVDDEHLIRSGIRMMLSTEPDMEVIGEAANGDEAIQRIGELAPDVVLMDLRMPGMDGAAATRHVMTTVADPPAIIVLTTFHADREVQRALAAGAVGYLLKDAPEQRITAAIRGVAQGATVFDPEVAKQVLSSMASGPPGPPPISLAALTARETDVLRLVAQGLSNRAIARELFLGEATIKTHVSRILMKLSAESRAEAVVAAYESGLVRPADASE